MKAITITLGITLVLYVLVQPGCQYRALQHASAAAERQDFTAAWGHVIPLLDEHPNFFKERTTTLCGQLSVQEAEVVSSSATPDYASAARSLVTQAKRCHEYVHPDTDRMVKRVATRHLEHAISQCKDKAYTQAQRTFDEIATLAYPEPLLASATTEAAWCRLNSVREYADKEWWDEAAETLARTLRSGENAVRRASLDLVPFVVEQEMAYWLAREQYVRAFERLEERATRFRDEAELGTLFTRLERKLEHNVFGVVLAGACLGQDTRLTAQVLPVATATTTDEPLPPLKNLTVTNAVGYPLEVIVVGPQRQALEIPHKKREAVLLPAGKYLVGLYAPGQCSVKPERAVWTVEEYGHRTITVSLQKQR